MKYRKTIPNRTRRLSRRFAFLRWSLHSLQERVAATRADNIMNDRAAAKRYPIRGIRYWWTRCALLEELASRSEETVIADVGCSTGHIARYVGPTENTRWIGLDQFIDRQALQECGYQEWHQCDFDQELPLADDSVDIVIFLHVIEHLPRPEYTLDELSRILRPGGLLIAGCPIAPRWIARIRERWHRKQHARGRGRPFGHLNSMDCHRWRTMLRASNMNPEIMSGTFLVRWSSNPLENQAWWVRFNQIWGALFPGLGGELYLSARKPSTLAATAAPVFTPGRPTIWKPAWGLALLLLSFGLWFGFSRIQRNDCPVHALASEHQDGNDTFFVIEHPALHSLRLHDSIVRLDHFNQILSEHAKGVSKGNDPHYVIATEALDTLDELVRDLGLQLTDETQINGTRFALLRAPEREDPWRRWDGSDQAPGCGEGPGDLRFALEHQATRRSIRG